MAETLRFTRRNLPHWLVADHAYFVTLRLAGTIPRSVVTELQAERDVLTKINASTETRNKLSQNQFLRVEQCLHAVDNTRDWLTQSNVPEMLLANLDWLDQRRGWQVYAITVLSNHVHLLMQNVKGRSRYLTEDMGCYKSYVATKANRILGRQETFWACEQFDHWCRTEAKVLGVAKYICANPVAAGLVKTWTDWPWTRCAEWLRPDSTAGAAHPLK